MRFKTTHIIIFILIFVPIMFIIGKFRVISNAKESYSGSDIDDLLILVADTANNRLLLRSKIENSIEWRRFGSEDIQFSSPEDIVPYKNELYIIDCGNDRIVVTDLNGKLTRKWGSFGWCYKECGRKNIGAPSCSDGKFNNPRSITILNDEVFIADKCNHRIQVFDLNGKFKRKWGNFGSAEGAFDTPTGITAYENEIYVADAYNSRIQVFSPDGTFHRMWGSYGSKHGEFDSPVKITVHENSVYVSDRNNHRIQVFTTRGNFLRSLGAFGSAPGCLNKPYGVSVYQDKVYIADRSNHRIQVFNKNGTFVNTWGNRRMCQKKALRKYFRKIMPFFCDNLNFYGPMDVIVISKNGESSNEYQLIK